MSNSKKLRQLIDSPSRRADPGGAQRALRDRSSQEAGIRGLWASSLTLSCAAGLRDNSELTMTEVLDVLESITAKVDIPILFDGDTGYRAVQPLPAARSQALPAPGRRRLHRGQGLSQDQLLPSLRGAGARADRRVLRKDPRGQGRPDGPGLRGGGPHRGADRRPRHGAGARPRGEVRRGRCRRGADPLEGPRPSPIQEFMSRWSAPCRSSACRPPTTARRWRPSRRPGSRW